MVQAALHHGNPLMADYSPAAAVDAGVVVVAGNLIGIAHQDIPVATANRPGTLGVNNAVYKLAKGAVIFTRGDWVYWDDTNNVATPTVTGKRFGLCNKDAASGDATVETVLVLGANLPGWISAAIAASAAVTGVTAETAFDKTVTIPAASLLPGDIIRVRAQLVATATNSTDTLDMQLRLGTQDIVATGAVDVANGDIGYIDVDIVVREVGATGKIVAAGVTALGVPGTVTAKPKFLAETSIDTTAALSLNVSATWSSTNAGNSCRLDILNAQLIRA